MQLQNSKQSTLPANEAHRWHSQLTLEQRERVVSAMIEGGTRNDAPLAWDEWTRVMVALEEWVLLQSQPSRSRPTRRNA
ncbi:hypothetical protein [Pendulispora albinea]|uniref:Uncharacterized protein n=1 Tax=Pendulispora albinea TaxID=2741071 RepID=A0ABZ2M3I8_9BACT